jgi:hypothetical protein
MPFWLGEGFHLSNIIMHVRIRKIIACRQLGSND